MLNIKIKYFENLLQQYPRLKKLYIYSGLSFCALLSACSTTQANYQTVGSLDNLTQLQNLHAQATTGKKQMTALHSQALQDIAMSVGLKPV